jgi:hypothetical protein
MSGSPSQAVRQGWHGSPSVCVSVSTIEKIGTGHAEVDRSGARIMDTIGFQHVRGNPRATVTDMAHNGEVKYSWSVRINQL